MTDAEIAQKNALADTHNPLGSNANAQYAQAQSYTNSNQVDTSQPSPQMVTGNTPLNPQISQAQPQLNSPLTPQTPVVPQANPQNTANKYKTGFQMIQNNPAPTTSSAGSQMVQNTVSQIPQPPQPNPLDAVFQQATQTPEYQQLMSNYQQAFNIASQQESLTSMYDRFSKDLGISALNTQLMDMKKVIDGTEDDLRNEITKAGGFATESQIQALTNARNKQLITNYNNLLQTKNSLTEQLNTSIGLAQQDRAYMQQQIDRQLDFSKQMLDYRDKMQTNAQNQLQKIVDSQGYAGLYNMTQGNPYYTSLVEKTLGLPQGGLQQAANYVAPLTEKEKLQNQLLQAQIANEKAGTANLYSQINERNNKNTTPLNTTPLTQKQASTTSSLNQVDTINGLLGNSNGLKASVGTTGFFGRGGLIRGAIGAKQDFTAGVQQLTSQLTLDNLINAKAKGATFGALSEGELNILAGGATKLNSWAKKDKAGNIIGFKTSEANVRRELDTINNLAKKDYIIKGGDPSSIGVQQMADGTYWAQNSDGSMTQII